MPEQQRIRREKREKLLQSGGEAYPVIVDRTISITDLRDKYVVLAEGENEPESTPAHAAPVTYLRAGDETTDEVAIAGRVLFIRNTGKLCFATIQEGSGTQIQAMLSLAEVGPDLLAAWKSDVDLGDIVSVRGRVIVSKRGALSLVGAICCFWRGLPARERILVTGEGIRLTRITGQNSFIPWSQKPSASHVNGGDLLVNTKGRVDEMRFSMSLLPVSCRQFQRLLDTFSRSVSKRHRLDGPYALQTVLDVLEPTEEEYSDSSWTWARPEVSQGGA